MSALSVLLESIDTATQCWLERKRFALADPETFARALQLDSIELNRVYDLEPADLVYIASQHGIAFDDPALPVIMVIDRGPHEIYDEQVSHTGRELLLMLAGRKPLAVFSEEYPLQAPESFIPEALFDRFVIKGRFIKKVEITRREGTLGIRRVLYAIPDQQWRINAYSMLWLLAEKYGWSQGLEQAEGYLLGYESEIDHAFQPATSSGPITTA